MSQTDKTATIQKQFGRLYLSYTGQGTRSKRTFKTVAGAVRYAEKQGYVVTDVDFNEVVPLSCVPGTESYLSF